MAEPIDDVTGDHPTARYHVDDAVASETLVSGAVGDRCVNCGTSLSTDQRYCVVCGERRGAARFSLPDAPAPPTPASADGGASRGSRGVRLGAGVLIGGVATLLLAILVGVLIGHDVAASGTRTVAAADPPVRIIEAGGGSSASSATTTAAASAGTHAAKSKASAPTTKAAKKAAAAEQNAASKVLGGKQGPPPTVTVGQSGSGPGFSKKTHKFTGTFFGQ